jgi:CheY-like chemotaxis protein
MKVLVSDDDVLLRLLLVEELASAHMDVVEAATALEAIDYLTTQAVDLVITDVRMPGTLDGTDVAAYSKRRYPATPVIVISGFPTSEDERVADVFISKPIDMARLIAHVKDLMGVAAI